MKINIGSGSKRYPGFINCDYSSQDNPDYVFDLEKDVWPFEDSTVTHVIAYHILEHLGEGYFHALKELYRVCAPGATIDILVPHYNHHNFHHDATHKRSITPFGLNMFSKKQNYNDLITELATSRLGNYLDIDLELVSYSYNLDDRYKELLEGKTTEEIEFYAYDKVNIIAEISIKMMAIKGTREEQIAGYYLNYLNRKADKISLDIYRNSNLTMAEILEDIKHSEEYIRIQNEQ